MKKTAFVVVKGLLYLVSFLPFRLLYLISDILYFLFYHLLGYRKKVVYGNLRKSFPEKTEEEIDQIAKDFYRFLSDQLVEGVKMLSISKNTVNKRFRLNNPEEITKYLKQGKPVIAVTGHYGNWEWGALILSIQIHQPVVIIYKPITDKRFERLINRMRSKFNAVMVPMRNTLRKINELRNQPFLAVLVSDQTPAKNEISYFTRFLNQNTPVFLGIEKIAKLTDGAVVYCHINRQKRGFYECTFDTLFDQPKITSDKEITESYTKKLENIIQQKPELWLWSHRRWKYNTVENAEIKEL
jgi:Kdo2-lipid IVA lauroyltransferase/acyltransferase